MTDSTNTIKKADLKVTAFRKEVLDIINESNHAIPSEVIESRLSSFDRITLYRTLKSFEEKGIIHKVNNTEGTTLYAPCRHVCIANHKHVHEAHLHFQCNICNNLFCIEDVHIPNIELPGYEISGQNIILTGKCKNCI